MFQTTSVTRLRNNLAEFINSLAEAGAVRVVRQSEAAAYLVSPELFESLLRRVEDQEDVRDVRAAREDYRRDVSMPRERVKAEHERLADEAESRADGRAQESLSPDTEAIAEALSIIGLADSEPALIDGKPVSEYADLYLYGESPRA